VGLRPHRAEPARGRSPLSEPAVDEAGYWSPRTIVVGYDGTSSAERALMHAIELARRFDSRVIVADVPGPHSLRGTPGGFGYAPYYALTDPDPRNDEAVTEQHRASVDSLFARTGLRHEFACLVGEPAAEIVAVAEQRDADLIVVGTPEPGFFARLLEGNVSQGIARHANRDVLIVHPPQSTGPPTGKGDAPSVSAPAA
jgi:nucleotide-binding universal stress UspA family protein